MVAGPKTPPLGMTIILISSPTKSYEEWTWILFGYKEFVSGWEWCPEELGEKILPGIFFWPDDPPSGVGWENGAFLFIFWHRHIYCSFTPKTYCHLFFIYPVIYKTHTPQIHIGPEPSDTPIPHNKRIIFEYTHSVPYPWSPKNAPSNPPRSRTQIWIVEFFSPLYFYFFWKKGTIGSTPWRVLVPMHSAGLAR